MKFLYKNDNGELIFQNFKVIVRDEDPDVEKFLSGEYKNYTIIYDDGFAGFTADVKKGILTKTYKVHEIYYRDNDHYYVNYDKIEGKTAKKFIENFEKILENPKNILVIQYLESLPEVFSIENIPYRSYYYDQQYILEHGFMNALFIDKNKTYLEMYSLDLEIQLGKKDTHQIINGLFGCKEYKCIKSVFGKLVKIINTKRIITKELHDIILKDNVLALVQEDDTYYFLIKAPNGKIYKYYTNPEIEQVFYIEEEGNENVKTDLNLNYNEFLDLLNKNIMFSNTEK